MITTEWEWYIRLGKHYYLVIWQNFQFYIYFSNIFIISKNTVVSSEKWLILLRVCIIRHKLRKEIEAYFLTQRFKNWKYLPVVILYICKFSNKAVGRNGSFSITYYLVPGRIAGRRMTWKMFPFSVNTMAMIHCILSAMWRRIIFKFYSISFWLVVEFKNTRGIEKSVFEAYVLISSWKTSILFRV